MKAKVTLTIEPDLWRQFRAKAILRGASASAEIEKLLRAQLEKWAKETARMMTLIAILLSLISASPLHEWNARGMHKAGGVNPITLSKPH